MYNGKRDLINIVWQQLPEGLKTIVELDVECDAYFLKATTVVRIRTGQTFKAQLEPFEFEGTTINAKVPDTFITLLCTVA